MAREMGRSAGKEPKREVGLTVATQRKGEKKERRRAGRARERLPGLALGEPGGPRQGRKWAGWGGGPGCWWAWAELIWFLGR